MFLVHELAKQQIGQQEHKSWPIKGSIAVFLGLAYVALMLSHI
ncbi:hypothetical protein SAMN04488500_105141 [Sporomusa malonica]|uniref:Uncharacterized protein n=1 Tax=Sporomusa malonica TaxID=112901 RepID=A0A1W2A7Y1_9FIRM|nr:hypothetical protein SAMN04488500_105141 [Sporomusa malonica]